MLLVVLSLASLMQNPVARIDGTGPRLVCVGDIDTVVRVRVDDVVQICPFDLPLTPATLHAEPSVRIEGDRCLEWIGGTRTGRHDGRVAPRLFLVAQEPGVATVCITLDFKGGRRPVAATYTIRVDEVNLGRTGAGRGP
jgi:hypothetical protein